MKRILLIEEDQGVRSLLSDFLRREGFQVIDTNNAMTGLFLGKEFYPDLIIVDLELKGLNAYEFMKTLGESSSEGKIPFIVLTDDPDNLNNTMRSEARNLGAHICFKKSVNLPLILEFISINIELNYQIISEEI